MGGVLVFTCAVAEEKKYYEIRHKSLRKAYQTASSGDELITGTACRKTECQLEYDRQD